MKTFRRPSITNILVLGLALFLLGAFFPWRSLAIEVAIPVVRDLNTLIGEKLEYDIGFLWFDQLAEAYLTFNRGEKEGTFTAILEAKTLGVAAWLTDYQRQKLVTSMEMDERGRFRTLKYDWLKIKGKGEKRHVWTKSYIFDYSAKSIAYVRSKDDRETSRKVFALKDAELPGDALTALYNFRIGVYGDTMSEEPLVIPGFSRKGKSEIILEVASPKASSTREFFAGCRPLIRGKVDSEVFDTSGGFIFACLDAQGRPFKGIVENVMGLGDVRGSLKKARMLGSLP